MAVFDRIKYTGNSNESHWLIYKYPSDQLVLGSQLVVSQGQEALLFKGGEALDLFGPGTYTLTTGNLPILNKLVNLPFGGKTPFSAEIYFVNKTVNLDMKWGTSTPIPIEDPKYGLILNIGARGQYGMSIKNSRLFVSNIIGAIPNSSQKNHLLILRFFNGLINAKIKSITADYMIKKQVSFLEISQYLAELSDSFKEKLDDEFERFGIDLKNFYCISIAPSPEEYEKLREYKEELALGSKFYQQRRSLDIIEKLAENHSIDINSGKNEKNFNCFRDITHAASVQSLICSHCGAQNNTSMKFCGECGRELIKQRLCPYCGAVVSENIKFCGECGSSLITVECSACGFINKGGSKFCGSCGQKIKV